jgi:predicted ferric reductase
MVKLNAFDPRALLGIPIGFGAAALLWYFGGPVANAFGSLLGMNSQEGLWYMTRAAGLVAYLLLWLSTVWGLAVASKIFDPVLHRAFTFDVHEWLSLLAIGFTALHLGALVADQYMSFSVLQVLFPFITEYRPFWVGIGVIGMWLTLLVSVTFYLRNRIGQKAFRTIHLFSFASYASVTLHSLFAGTDSTLWSARLIYGATALVVALLSVHYFATKHARKTARAT